MRRFEISEYAAVETHFGNIAPALKEAIAIGWDGKSPVIVSRNGYDWGGFYPKEVK